MTRDLRALPKAHLHLHFTGSMQPSTLLDLAQDAGLRLPASLVEAVAPGDADGTLRLPPNERGWFRFQRMYDAARAVVRGEAAMRRIVDEAVALDAADGGVRLELQVDPTSYAPFVGGLTPALEIVLDAAAQAARSHSIEVGVIVAASRTRHPFDARTLARLAAAYAGENGVVGFGLSNDERRGATEQFAPAFQIAARAGLALVPHGGELLGPSHVADVVAHLHPHRLGHGIRSSEDPALLARLVQDGVALEVCPTSNVALGVYEDAAQVPLRTLLAAGADVALGADDPLIFGARLLDQYRLARDQLGLQDHQIAELARGSIRASRTSDAARARWLADVDAWLAADPDAAAGCGTEPPHGTVVR